MTVPVTLTTLIGGLVSNFVQVATCVLGAWMPTPAEFKFTCLQVFLTFGFQDQNSALPSYRPSYKSMDDDTFKDYMKGVFNGSNICRNWANVAVPYSLWAGSPNKETGSMFGSRALVLHLHWNSQAIERRFAAKLGRDNVTSAERQEAFESWENELLKVLKPQWENGIDEPATGQARLDFLLEKSIGDGMLLANLCLHCHSLAPSHCCCCSHHHGVHLQWLMTAQMQRNTC